MGAASAASTVRMARYPTGSTQAVELAPNHTGAKGIQAWREKENFTSSAPFTRPHL